MDTSKDPNIDSCTRVHVARGQRGVGLGLHQQTDQLKHQERQEQASGRALALNELGQETVDGEQHDHGPEPSNREGDDVSSSVSLILDKGLDIDQGEGDVTVRT